MPQTKAKYCFSVPDSIVSLIKSLHPLIKNHIRMGLNTILENPYTGKALKEELNGLRSYKVKRYRIIYRVVSSKKELEIIAIGPRRNIYEETFIIISKEEKKKR